ncbi:MAG: hypothetical protein ACXW2O_00540 [Candidatus Aminicenantales bacterium]
MKTLLPFRSPGIVILAFSLIGCRGGSIEGWSSRARTMILTSGPTEISMSSSKVPGYWAEQADSGQEFFLYTRARSYEKGSRVKVEGPFGNAFPAVFRDDAGLYLQGYPTYILVVWKIERSDDQKGDEPPVKEVTDRAPHP